MDYRPTHPLKAWRETQRRIDSTTKQPVPLSISMAAAALGVSYQTWWAWELYPDEKGHKLPDRRYMIALYRYTNGQVPPNHFYNLPDLRAEAAVAAAEGGDSPDAPVNPPSGASGRGRGLSAAPSFSEAAPV